MMKRPKINVPVLVFRAFVVSVVAIPVAAGMAAMDDAVSGVVTRVEQDGSGEERILHLNNGVAYRCGAPSAACANIEKGHRVTLYTQGTEVHGIK